MNPTDAVRATDDSSFGDLTCPICGEAGVVTYDHHDTFEYGSGDAAVTLQVELPIRRCEACDFEFLDQEGERLKHEAVCRHLGVLTSTEIRQIRKRYGMTRSSFAEFTGLGEATLNRWENGVVIQNRANDRYLRLLGIEDIFHRLTDLHARTNAPLEKPDSTQRSHFRVLRVSPDHRRRQAHFQLRKAS